jgi:EpsI family protein
LRLAAVAVALLIPALVLASWVRTRGASGHALALPLLPQAIGQWKLSESTLLSPLELEALEPDAYLARTYVAPGRLPVGLYLALYSEQTSYGRGAHDPTVCYPGHGWEVVATHSVEVALPGGESFVGNAFVAHRGTAKQKVLYWFQPAERWPGRQLREQVVRIWDALRGQPQYAFVRIRVPSLRGHDDERDLLEFAAEVAWPIRRALSPEGESGLVASDAGHLSSTFSGSVPPSPAREAPKPD